MHMYKHPFLYSTILSVVVNASIINVAHHTFVTEKHIPKKIESVIFQLPQRYIDTPNQDIKKDLINEKFISDNDSILDSSLQGEVEGILPQAAKQQLNAQAKRELPSKTLRIQQHLEQVKKKLQHIEREEQLERDKQTVKDKVSIINNEKNKQKTEKDIEETPIQDEDDIEKVLEEIKQTDISINKKESLKKDLFPLPSISIGNHNFSKLGIDSFAANASLLGKYMKRLRDKIGLKFYQMIFFHYKTTYIFASKTKIVFNIDKRGHISRFSSKLITGDILFKDYCETVIKSASPFAPLSKKLKPYLEEDGTLQIDFLFGYNIPEN